MAEGGIINTIVGGETEAREGEAAPPDAAAIAIAMDEAGKHAAVAGDASAFLQAQRQLVDLQVKHFDAERLVALQTARIRRTTDQIKLVMLGATAVLLVAIVTGFAALAWSATDDRGVVINAFSVPPDLVQRGLTGRVVASLIQDKLTTLDSQSESLRPARSYANDWGGDIKVEIPETGVSIGEVSRLLHESLGHATHIDGEVFRGAAGLTVVARVDGAATAASGPEADLDKLVEQAAEGVFARTQPYRYAVWLFKRGQVPQAVAVYKQLVDGSDPEDRFWGLIGLSHQPDAHQGRLAAMQAVAMRPASGPLVTLALAEDQLGHDEAELAAWRGAANSPPSRSFAASLDRSSRLEGQFNSAAELGDFGRMHELAALLQNDRAMLHFVRVDSLIASFDADIERHRRFSTDDEDAVIAMGDTHARADVTALRGADAVARKDWAAIALLGATARQEWIEGALVRSHPDLAIAESYVHLGRDPEADALLRSVAGDNYDGLLTRGRIAAFRRDWAGAARNFAEAARQGPSLPRGYKDWGDMLAAKGDLAGAETKYAEANRHGPKWADPLKAWGDTLVRQGQLAAAAAKYQAALTLAPDWLELRQLPVQLRASRHRANDATAPAHMGPAFGNPGTM